MSEPTLNVKMADLEQAVGVFLGYGKGLGNADWPAWSARQQAVITDCLASGLRAFYYPEPPTPGGPAHEWTFLRPVATLALPAGAHSVNLPDDFGWAEDQVTVTAAGQSMLAPVDVTGEGVIRKRFAEVPDLTGRPQLAAVDPMRGTTARESQRFALLVWPAADMAYTLSLAYYLHADALSTQAPFAYGGPAHAETIRAAVVAAAERELDDVEGPRAAYFKQRLAASVANDRRGKPQELGYNGDQSDGPEWWNRRWLYNGAQVSYRGTLY